MDLDKENPNNININNLNKIKNQTLKSKNAKSKNTKSENAKSENAKSKKAKSEKAKSKNAKSKKAKSKKAKFETIKSIILSDDKMSDTTDDKLTKLVSSKHSRPSNNKNIKFINEIKETINYGIQSYQNLQQRYPQKPFKKPFKKPEHGRLKRPNSQSGGVVIDTTRSADVVFEDFIQNSKITILSKASLSGLIFLATFDPADKTKLSPYTRYNTKSLMEKQVGNVRSICIKLVNLKEDDDIDPENVYYQDNIICKRPKKKDKVGDFINEIATQNTIALESAVDYEMSTPYIVYSSIYEINTPLLQKILEPTDDPQKEDCRSFLIPYGSKEAFMGLIAMEFIEDSVPLAMYRFKPREERISELKLSSTILYEYIRIAIDTGYLHCDTHHNNVFVVNYDSYTTDPTDKIKIMIIDWGRWVRFDNTSDEIKKLKIAIDNNKDNALKIAWKILIKTIQKKTNLCFEKNMGWTNYEWIFPLIFDPTSSAPDPMLDAEINTLSKLHESRREQIGIAHRAIGEPVPLREYMEYFTPSQASKCCSIDLPMGKPVDVDPESGAASSSAPVAGPVSADELSKQFSQRLFPSPIGEPKGSNKRLVDSEKEDSSEDDPAMLAWIAARKKPGSPAKKASSLKQSPSAKAKKNASPPMGLPLPAGSSPPMGLPLPAGSSLPMGLPLPAGSSPPKKIHQSYNSSALQQSKQRVFKPKSIGGKTKRRKSRKSTKRKRRHRRRHNRNTR